MPAIKRVYLYEETHLPEKGWLQGCIICGTITSKLSLFDTKINKKKETLYEIYTYICPKCLKNLSDSECLKNYNDISNKLLKNSDY